MDFISFESVCRCCLSNTGNFTSIFEIYQDYYLPKVIFACTGLTIQQSDGLPDVVCEACLAKLITAYETRRLFLRSNGQLKEQLHRLKQSEQEILIELNSTAAKCAAAASAASSAENVDLLPSVDNILEQNPITTWDNEINMHIEQLQDGATDLGPNIESCLDELVIEKCQNLEKGGYSFPISEPLELAGVCDVKLEDFGDSRGEAELSSDEKCDEENGFPQFSEFSDSSSESEDDECRDCDAVAKAEQDNPQPCEICGKIYRNSHLLRRHIRYHNNNQIDCPICLRSFKHTSNLKRHLSVHVPPDDGFACPKCPRKFTKGDELYDHLKHHEDIPPGGDSGPFVMHCDRCELKTLSLARFVAHMVQTHGVPKNQVKAFRCQLCSVRFVSKQGMIRHEKRVHQNQEQPSTTHPIPPKKFLCTECGKCFKRMRHLDAHANIHKGVRPFVCECGLSFSQQSGLRLHFRAKHENRLIHSCGVCQKSFTQSAHLKQHELIHSNRKEHECTVCKHRFRVKSNLMAHMRVHRRHPYRCNDCGIDLNDSPELEQHMKDEHSRS